MGYFQELHKLYEVKKTLNHRQGNAQCEHFNRTPHDLSRHSLLLEKKHCRPEYFQELLNVYNGTPHETTGDSPHYLWLGVQSHLPVDALLGQKQV